MQTRILILVATVFIAGMAYSTKQQPVKEVNPGCIVQPEVIEACVNSGGRFDYKTCSCVGGGAVK